MRVVREATSNICKHGASGGARRHAASSLGTDTMTLSWLSDHDGRNSEPGEVDLAGMAERAKQLGTARCRPCWNGCFRLPAFTLPRPADA